MLSFVTMCQNKMQVDQDDQKPQAGDNGDKKTEAEEMEVALCWAITQYPFTSDTPSRAKIKYLSAGVEREDTSIFSWC